MIAKKIRAVSTAFVFGTAAMAVATMPADAAMRSVVGKPLQEALSLDKSGNFAAACTQVKKAEAAGSLTAEESKGTNQMKEYVASASKGAACADGAIGAQAKFNADWNARKYRDVIADEEMLRKYNVFNATSQVVIAQAYEQLGDYKGCISYANAHASAGADMLKRGGLCAYKSGDDVMALDLALKLVAVSPSPENWSQLLSQAERAKGLSDAQTLDIYRLKLLTGNMKGADDYFTLAQLLLAAKLPHEAASVVEKGQAAKLLVDARAQRLVGLVKQNQASDVAGLAKAQADAQKAKTGDDLVKIGEDLTGMGKFADAATAIQAGIAKGVKDADNAQVRLALAQYGAKQKPQALNSLEKAKASKNGTTIAKAWAAYIRGH